MHVDFQLLKTLFDKTKGRVKYRLGAKVLSLGATTEEVDWIDCSGLSRWFAFRAFGARIPDGSQQQLAWAKEHLRKLKSYNDVQYAKEDPNRLFIAFLSPKPGEEWPRHVWFVHLGQTIESRSKAGVSSQSWEHYKGKGAKCFEVTG